MRTKPFLAMLLLSILAISCSNDQQEKHQSSRNKVQDIKSKIIPFETGDVLIGKNPSIYIADKYLVIVDYRALAEHIHIFDKLSFKHIISTGLHGEGPDEITSVGHVVYDKAKGNLYVSDHSKQKIFGYNIDSVIKFPDYKHYIKTRMNDKEFPSEYFYINDSLSYARIIQPTGVSGFNEILAKWSYTSGKIKELYKNPAIKKRRITFTVSPENEIYVECYYYHDLMTICDMDGNLKYNIYGPNWDDRVSNETVHFQNVVIAGNNIITSYSGRKNFTEESYSDKLLIYNTKGDYIKTLKLGHKIYDMCLDKESNRLYFSFRDLIQFGYLELTDKVLNK